MPGLTLNQQQKTILMDIAKKTIEAAALSGKVPDFTVTDQVLKEKCGAFVTIHKKGNLRGCIGNIIGTLPLWETVRKMAVAASLHDPRFAPLSPDELEDIDIEISVISPF